jgi:hypothetical protein
VGEGSSIDHQAHRFSRSPPGLVAEVPTPTPTGFPVSASRSRPACPAVLLVSTCWCGGWKKGHFDRRSRWLDDRMTGSVVSLLLPFCLSALRFCVSCVSARCVFLLRCVLSLPLLFPIWIPLMPCNAGYYAAVETCKSFFSPFPVPFFSPLL